MRGAARAAPEDRDGAMRHPIRTAFVILALVAAAAGSAAAAALDDAPWRFYRDRFVDADGRVVDRDNQSVTHSESQGYGMLFAVAFDDRATFARIWEWTNRTLRRDDGLFSWKFDPAANDGKGGVPDPNNASDGDILIAWALLRASRRWDQPELAEEARRLATTIADRLFVEHDARLLILPGADGFETEDKLVVNLSYWVFPALDALGTLTGDERWRRVADSGVALLLETARFGRWGLPPDWLDLAGKPAPAAGFPPWYGYNAVRIPLHLAWGGRLTAGLARPYVDFWTFFAATPFHPAWADLVLDSVDTHGWSEGVAAIAGLTWAVTQKRPGALALPPLGQDQGYFSSSLYLLTRLAVEDIR